MKKPNFVHDSLLCLTYGLKNSDIEFSIPEEGFKKLAQLFHGIAQAIEDAGDKRADAFRSERILFDHLHEFLIHDQALGLWTSVFRQFSDVGQNIIIANLSIQWDILLDFLRNITDPEDFESDKYKGAIDEVFAILQYSNRHLKDHVREYMLSSAAFWEPDILSRVPLSKHCGELGLIHDAALRARNLALRPQNYHSIGPHTHGKQREKNPWPQNEIEETDPPGEEVSGAIADYAADDDFLSFPGRLNDIPLSPIIDTGGACNLIRTDWLQQHGLEHIINRDPQRSTALLMADGSASKNMAVIDVKWSFDGRDKTWTNVEFTVVDNFQHGALIGMPFLKHTETLHTSGGKMVFPEFKGVRPKKEAVPMYSFGAGKPRK